jgi:hypothetical protein
VEVEEIKSIAIDDGVKKMDLGDTKKNKEEVLEW